MMLHRLLLLVVTAALVSRGAAVQWFGYHNMFDGSSSTASGATCTKATCKGVAGCMAACDAQSDCVGFNILAPKVIEGVSDEHTICYLKSDQQVGVCGGASYHFNSLQDVVYPADPYNFVVNERHPKCAAYLASGVVMPKWYGHHILAVQEGAHLERIPTIDGVTWTSSDCTAKDCPGWEGCAFACGQDSECVGFAYQRDNFMDTSRLSQAQCTFFTWFPVHPWVSEGASSAEAACQGSEGDPWYNDWVYYINDRHPNCATPPDSLVQVPITGGDMSTTAVSAVDVLTAVSTFDSDFDTGCHSADGDAAPWVQLDLGSSVEVHRVFIYNFDIVPRLETHYSNTISSRVVENGLELYVGDSATFSTTANSLCKVFAANSNHKWPATLDVHCNQPTSGRYVFLRIPTNSPITNPILSVSEIQIYTLGRLVQASVSAATLSSGTTAANAIDGNTGTEAASTSSTDPALQLDLGSSAAVHKVVIRNVASVGDRLGLYPLEVRVGDSTTAASNTICRKVSLDHHITTVGQFTAQEQLPLELEVWCLQPVSGQYVQLVLLGSSRTLRVTETSVFTAELGAPPPPSLPPLPAPAAPLGARPPPSVCCTVALANQLFRLYVASTNVPLQNLCQTAC